VKNIYIWDTEKTPKTNEKKLILWNEYNIYNNKNYISIIDIVENKSAILKSKFLEIVSNFEKKKINQTNIIEYFFIRKKFSYWWMTLINEKSNIAKSLYINDVIKLIALEFWLQENKVNSITLCSDKKALGESISTLCKNLNINFKIICNNKKIKFNYLKIFKYTKILLIIYLIYYYLANYKLIKLKNLNYFKSKKSITIISYFLNFDKILANKSIFKSNYWSGLTKQFENKNINTNWLHIYSKNEGFSSVSEASLLLSNLNNNNKKQFHFTQFSSLSIKTCIQVIKDSFKLHNLYLNFPSNSFFISFYGSSLNYWPLFRADFEKSFNFKYLIINMISFNFFEYLSSELKQQDKIFYLQENQSWEMPFIYLFNLTSKINKFGFSHSGIRYWDLRYFNHTNYSKAFFLNKPRPDYVAVNGPIAKKLLTDENYPDNEIVKVESLRHMHLLNSPKIKPKINDKLNLNILILGDYSLKINFKMLKLLDSASSLLPNHTRFIFKPHPSKISQDYNFTKLKLQISKEPINFLLQEANIVYASDQTSSTNDAYYNGVPIVIFLNQEILNLSPLRGFSNVDFVYGKPEILAKKILLNSDKFNKVNLNDSFYLNKDLKYWNKLL